MVFRYQFYLYCLTCLFPISICLATTSPSPESTPSRVHTSIETSYLQSSKAKFKEENVKDQHLQVKNFMLKAAADLEMTSHIVAHLIANYHWEWYHWAQNPYFEQKNFNQLKLTAGTSITPTEPFSVHAYLDYIGDFPHFFNIDNGGWQGSLWGRYAFTENFAFSLGAVYWHWIEEYKLLPIIGLEYAFTKNLRLAIFCPKMARLMYFFNEKWALFLDLTYERQRHRVDKHQALSKAIFEYTSYYTKLSLQFFHDSVINQEVNASVFIGASIGSHLKMMNQNAYVEEILRNKVGFLWGAEINMHF